MKINPAIFRFYEFAENSRGNEGYQIWKIDGKSVKTLNLDLLKLSRENIGSQINHNQSIFRFYEFAEFAEKNLVETKRVNLWIFPCQNNLAKMNGVKSSMYSR